MVALLDAAGLHGIKKSLETNESFLSTVSASPLEEATCVQSMLAQEELRKEPGKGSLRSSTVELLSFSGELTEALLFLTSHLSTSMETADQANGWRKLRIHLEASQAMRCSSVIFSPSCAEHVQSMSLPSLRLRARVSCSHRPADAVVG